jgi:predicted NAD/FAD-binding protein
LLSQHHEVTVYEAENRLGGHSNTVPTQGATLLPIAATIWSARTARILIYPAAPFIRFHAAMNS